MTNPQVLRETLASGGQNLVRGLNNLLADIEKGGGKLRISMTDESAFQLGRNVATTPGKVVFQNDLMQLIQYQPLTEQVYKRPLVIIPPWINKYYILDLREKNSFIRWAVSQGHTVFVISWVNPDARLAQKGFEDYMLEGPLAALDAVEKATGEREVNFIGYCLGGTLLGATLALSEPRNNRNRVASATFFVSLLDFSQPGELGVFIDEAQVQSLETQDERARLPRGLGDGGHLQPAARQRPGVVVRGEQLPDGQGPVPVRPAVLERRFDAHAGAHAQLLPAQHVHPATLLGVPGGIELAGVPIDLSKVTLPAYFISTVEDHIAPWKTTYKGAQYLGGPVRFVLGGSGHIAGIVNPPAAKKYHYWTNDAMPAIGGRMVRRRASSIPGSWWEDWQRWIEPHGGGKAPARIPGEGALKALEDAPGSYAKMRIALLNGNVPRLSRRARSEPVVEPARHRAQQRPTPAPSARESPPGAACRSMARAMRRAASSAVSRNGMRKRLTRVIGVSM